MIPFVFIIKKKKKGKKGKQSYKNRYVTHLTVCVCVYIDAMISLYL